MLSWLQQHMLPCAFKYFFGIDCPLCGAQRSLLLLMHGNFNESFKMYPPLLFVLIMILLAVTYLLVPSIINTKFIKYYAAFALMMVVINYAFKIAAGNLHQ